MKEIKVQFCKEEHEALKFAQDYANKEKKKVTIAKIGDKGFVVIEEDKLNGK